MALIPSRAIQAVPELVAALEMPAAEQPAKILASLKRRACHRLWTNNHGERINRMLRHQEKTRYPWRRRRRWCGSC
ncbi:MAG: hypothetical protein JO329_19380 [Planctomycetaceae bacterium]|nr:hypothetical protein [Planctomycetaceae bacterium]